MKNAIIYTRVSTDEQADKGFSLPYQKETLKRFCEIKKLNIIKHFREDYSAKTFDRPEWKKLVAYCKANRKEIDMILFTKWDRFSRNAAESYQVIDMLRRLGIQVNSIEQPLDLEQPDNKIMLAIYLAVPEVENDKISIRVKEGSRRANKEGCCTSIAPIGYKNQRTPEGKSSLAPSEKSLLIEEAFRMVVETGKPVDEIRRVMLKKGLKISRSRFHKVIRNPVYIGKITVPAYKDEDMEIVEGLHQGIVPERLFYQVQDVLNGRKRKTKKRSLKDEHLPLRGHIQCSRCGKSLTGSASTGRLGGKYYYYHCRKGCKERFKVADAHALFDKYIASLTVSPGKAALYLQILKEQYGNNKESKARKIAKMKTEIETLKQTIEKAEDNLFEGKIDMRSFNKGKGKYTQRIADLEYEIAELKATGSRFMEKLHKAVEVFKNLKTFYDSGSWETKQMILGSTFPEKLIFEKNKCRTPKLNTVLNHIFQLINELTNIKKGQTHNILNLSCSVGPQGLEP